MKMSPTKCDARGSPRVFKAANMLFTSKESLGMHDAMKLVGYTRCEVPCQHILQSISKKKCRLQQANAKGKRKKVKARTIVTASTKQSNVSDLTSSSHSNNISDGASTSNKAAKVSVASGKKLVQP
jgi:hypothetical protein